MSSETSELFYSNSKLGLLVGKFKTAPTFPFFFSPFFLASFDIFVFKVSILVSLHGKIEIVHLIVQFNLIVK